MLIRSELVSSSPEISFSPSRGFIHGFNLKDDSVPVQVIANGGAQLMNSRHYFERRTSLQSAQIIRENQEQTTGYMMAFSKQGDTFIFTAEDPERAVETLKRINDSYEQVGIGVASQFLYVGDIDEVISPVLPQVYNVLSPEVLNLHNLTDVAVKNVAAYRKDTTEKVWRLSGVPTPPTVYINGAGVSEYLANEEMFRLYSELVMNTVEGSGGFGQVFIPKEEIQHWIGKFKQEYRDEIIQIQGCLQLAGSPCLIFYLSDNGFSFLGGSEQRFVKRKPGVYSGSIWQRGIEEDWNKNFPNFKDVTARSVRVLQQNNVRGQINVDILTLTKATADYYDLPQVLLREANVRPAGSSVLLRLKNDADVNGQKPTKILTNTSKHIPTAVFFDQSLLKYVNSQPDLKTLIYNYYAPTQKAGLAFLGNENVTISQLHTYEKNTLRSLYAW